MEKLRGHIDGLEPDEQGNWVLRGWACDTADGDRVLDVEVLEDTFVLGAGRAEIFREDVKSAGVSDGYCGFAIALQIKPRGRGGARGLAQTLRSGRGSAAALNEYMLCLRVAGGGGIIVAPTAVRLTTMVGYVDRLSGGVVSGWAIDLTDRTRPVEVEMLADGRVVERGRAGLHREDIAEKYRAEIGGFEWVVPVGLADGQPHRIAVRFAQSSVMLPSFGDKITVSADDLFTGRGMSRVPPAMTGHRRYLANIDQYYRATRIAIERITADCAIYYGHAANEFAPLLAQQFPKAYTGPLRSLTKRAVVLNTGDQVLYLIHTNAALFGEICLSGESDRLLLDRMAAGQPTILSVEAHDRERGLRGINLPRAKEWCSSMARFARAQGLEALLSNTLIDFFGGHPGIVLSLAPPVATATVAAAAAAAVTMAAPGAVAAAVA